MIGFLSKIINRRARNSLNKYYISVYEGISPALLATMSLSQGVKGKTNQQLISSLVKSNIIQNKIVESAMQKYDRQLFIPKYLNKTPSLYENKPYRISGNQNMTDIFTHAVILQQISYQLERRINENGRQKEKNISILDIGCGHGYLSFVLSQFLKSIFQQRGLHWTYSVLAIDSSLEAVQYCENLKKKLSEESDFKSLSPIQFKAQTIQSLIGQEKTFDIYVGGFYMPPTLHEGLLNKMKLMKQKEGKQGFGIWATDSRSGQSLYTFTIQNRKQREQKQDIVKRQIMSTMFSMPVTKTSVSKFFLEEGENTENAEESVEERERREEQLKKLKIQKRKQEREKAKEELAKKIQEYSTKLNKKLTLQDMRGIPDLKSLLEKLNQK